MDAGSAIVFGSGHSDGVDALQNDVATAHERFAPSISDGDHVYYPFPVTPLFNIILGEMKFDVHSR